MDSQEVKEAVDLLIERSSAVSFAYFLNNWVIASKPEPSRFGAVAEKWQWQRVAASLGAVENLAGINPGYDGPRSFMEVLPRGHDKSSHEARIVAWLLLFSRRPVDAYVMAEDKDQGRLILDALADETKLNTWTEGKLDVQKNVILGPAGRCTILPADAGSAYGLRGNLYIADEFTHWKRGKDVWKAFISGRSKVPGSVLIVCSNAGVNESWQHKVYKHAKKLKSWRVLESKGRLASWMSDEQIAEDRAMLPPSEAARLFDNKWINAAEDLEYLLPTEVQVCADLGDRLGLAYRISPAWDVSNYVASVDYGARKDRTALCLGHLDANDRVVVDRLDVWQGTRENPIQVAAVEDWIDKIEATFKPKRWVIDPFQMEGTIQKMQGRGLPVEAFASRGGQANQEMAQHIRSLVVNRKLVWYVGAGLLNGETLYDELVSLVVKRMSYGFRFDHTAQMHDDRAVAIGMMASQAVCFRPLLG